MLHQRQCMQSAACKILTPFQDLSECCCQSGRSYAGSLSNIILILKLLWWLFKAVHFLWPSAFVIADASLSCGMAEGQHYLVWLHWFSGSGRSGFGWGEEDQNWNFLLFIFSPVVLSSWAGWDSQNPLCQQCFSSQDNSAWAGGL